MQTSCSGVLSKKTSLVLGTEVLGCVHHVGQRSSSLFPASGLQTAVRVNPELVGWVDLQDLLNSGHEFFLRRNSWRVDIEQTQSNVVRVVGELLDVVRVVLLGKLNRNDIGIQSLDMVWIQVRVTEVRVDLSVVLNTRSSDSERLSSPVQVVGSFLTGSQWQTSLIAGSSTWMTVIPAASKS